MKAVIFIHGYLSNTEDFGSLPEELAPYYDEVIMISLPGHGKDAKIKDFIRENMLKLIDEELPQIINRYHQVDIIGFSLGGAIAKYLALFNSINKLVLLSPAVRYLSPLMFFRRMNFLFQTRSFQKIQSQSKIGNCSLDDKPRKYLWNHDKTALAFSFKNTTPRFRMSNAITFMELIHYMNKRKGNINCPTLVFWGYLDELVPYLAAKECYNQCIHPDKDFIIIPHVGHMMLRSAKMEEVKAIIKDFLKGSQLCHNLLVNESMN